MYRQLRISCVPYFSRLPEDSTPMPKHVGVDTYHESYFTICNYRILLTALVG